MCDRVRTKGCTNDEDSDPLSRRTDSLAIAVTRHHARRRRTCRGKRDSRTSTQTRSRRSSPRHSSPSPLRSKARSRARRSAAAGRSSRRAGGRSRSPPRRPKSRPSSIPPVNKRSQRPSSGHRPHFPRRTTLPEKPRASTTSGTSSTAKAPTTNTDELSQAKAILAGLIAKYPILAGTTVSMGTTPRWLPGGGLLPERSDPDQPEPHGKPVNDSEPRGLAHHRLERQRADRLGRERTPQVGHGPPQSSHWLQ